MALEVKDGARAAACPAAPPAAADGASEARPRKGLGLQELIMSVCEQLASGKRDDIGKVKELMEAYDGSLLDWKRYAHFCPKKLYTRNLIATDNSTFTFMLLCWNPKKASPIHSHAGSECFMRCVSGELTETCYSWPEREDEPPAPLKERVLKPGQVAYINDKCGLHRILNHTDVGATSLHLYMPPYDKCKIWIDEKCQRMQVGSVTFYSEDGQVVVDD